MRYGYFCVVTSLLPLPFVGNSFSNPLFASRKGWGHNIKGYRSCEGEDPGIVDICTILKLDKFVLEVYMLTWLELTRQHQAST